MKKDRQIIYEKLLDALNAMLFFDLDDLADESTERKEEFLVEKRKVREELQGFARGERPKKSFKLPQYKTHDGPKGSPDQWREAAKVILNVNDENCLTTLGLSGVPPTEAALKTAWRTAIRKAHPDLGGSEDEAARINAAYELCLKLFFTKMTKAGRKDTGLRPQLLTPITEEEAVKYLTDDLWCVQEKKDGKHGMIKKTGITVIAANKQGLEMSIPASVADAVLQFLIGIDAVIDGELIGDKFYIFDLLEYAGTDYRQYNYNMRYEKLKSLLPNGQFYCLILVPMYVGTKEKTDFFFATKAAKKEGVVFKRLDTPFKEGKPEVGGDMVKCKFWATLSAIVDETETQVSLVL